MQRILSTIALLSVPALGLAQTLTNNGASIIITSGTTLAVNGGFTNAAGSTLNNSGTLSITGNTINNGTTTAGTTANLNLIGTTAQTLSGSASVAARNVTVNNTAGITLSTPLRVDGIMAFTAGMITATNSNSPVVFTVNSSISGTPTDASHVNGYVTKEGTGSFTYPVGNATKYQPVGANLTANSAGMKVRYFDADAGAAPFTSGGSSTTLLLARNAREYWDLVPVGTGTGSVTIYFDGYNNVGIGSVSDLRVAHKTSTAWVNEGATSNTGTSTSGTVTSNSISTFSPFTLGSISSSSPLPVRITAFASSVAGAANRLEWHTAAEEAGTVYHIERSENGSLFEKIGEVASKQSEEGYVFYDNTPLVPVGFYRLQVKEPGGHSSYSQTIAVSRNVKAESVLSASPVPTSELVTITSTSKSLYGTEARVLDLQGRGVSRFTLQAIQQIDMSSWASGVYTLRLSDGTVTRLVKQ